jgi:hypothetical protein
LLSWFDVGVGAAADDGNEVGVGDLVQDARGVVGISGVEDDIAV